MREHLTKKERKALALEANALAKADAKVSVHEHELSDGEDVKVDAEHKKHHTTNTSSSNPLKTQFADPALLNKIDRLFACGVGEHISLPQLVVVGDQSSGKSSVLEGLTKLPFPRDSGLCTRFATQITFKRGPVKQTSIYVIAGPSASFEHKAKLKAWSKTDIKGLQEQPRVFLEIMEEVQDLMGLGAPGEAGSNGTFSEDVLRLEISGPDEQHLSVVDVPGIFQTVTENVTTSADIVMVEGMVRAYMENERSIMMTVVPANQDIATQKILTMAKEVDPTGQRTLGVLTKPDLVDKGAERSVLKHIQGTGHRLALGWQVVRNCNQDEINRGITDARDKAEREFFASKMPWNEVPQENRGIDSLRTRLNDLLTAHIRAEFPKVQAEIGQRLNAAKRTLEALGAKRSDAREQRMYLTDICSAFQTVKSNALLSNYNTPQFEECPSLRLPTYVRNRNDQFSSNMESFGHLYAFSSGENSLGSSFGFKKIENTLEGLIAAINANKNARLISDDSDGFKVRRSAKFHELYDCTISDSLEVEDTSRPGIMDWLNQQYTSTQGFELGTISPTLLTTLFREQAVKWDHLAKGYISDVIEMVHQFITDLLCLVASDEHVRSGITSKLLDPLLLRYQRALDHTDFLLKVEKESIPLTSNRAFGDLLQSFAVKRARALEEAKESDWEAAVAAASGAVGAGAPGVSTKESDILHTHNVLHAYYDVAYKRFVDNVCKQATLHHLVMGKESPLELFSASFVNGLDDEELDEIAGEDPLLKRRRAALEKEIGFLEAGKKILR